uniref:Uncharacterized protein n=1 Tax=Arundo donax TaxID=35708 RepID=A0A0A8Y4B1_ARUDO
MHPRWHRSGPLLLR